MWLERLTGQYAPLCSCSNAADIAHLLVYTTITDGRSGSKCFKIGVAALLVCNKVSTIIVFSQRLLCFESLSPPALESKLHLCPFVLFRIVIEFVSILSIAITTWFSISYEHPGVSGPSDLMELGFSWFIEHGRIDRKVFNKPTIVIQTSQKWLHWSQRVRGWNVRKRS